jgi:hypothetical protein
MKCNIISPPPKKNYGCGERGVPVFTVILMTLQDSCKVLKNYGTNFFNFVCVFYLSPYEHCECCLKFFCHLHAQVMYNLRIQLSFNNKTTNKSEAHSAIRRKINVISTFSHSHSHGLPCPKIIIWESVHVNNSHVKDFVLV